jgi:hypothetical protein
MKRNSALMFIVVCSLLLSSCGSGLFAPTATPTSTPLPTNTPTPLPPTSTPTPTVTPTPAYPPAGLGPTGFPSGVDPLTGLAVEDATLLNRRPIAIKVENLPRADRPQYGLSKTDLVYEYYTEEGSTRFIAIYYGQNATQVGPIRSARFFDVNVIDAYKSVFVFGSAWEPVLQRLYNSDFSNRLIIEGSYTSPALFRTNNGALLMANTTQLPSVITAMSINNSVQNEEGMFFKLDVPASGTTAQQVFIRFSSAIYNRWDYDATSGKYLRFEDTQDATNGPEVYGALVDAQDNSQVSADNVVIIEVPYSIYVRTADTTVYDASMVGTGGAYIARDGQIYKVTWSRPTKDSVLSLTGPDGQPFAFKPGNTWFEVVDNGSAISQPDSNSWRFLNVMP